MQGVIVNVDWNLISSQETGTITISSNDLDEPSVQVSVTAIPTSVGGSVVANVLATDVAQGSSTTIGIEVDMSGMDPPNNRLGSFTSTLAYDPNLLDNR